MKSGHLWIYNKSVSVPSLFFHHRYTEGIIASWQVEITLLFFWKKRLTFRCININRSRRGTYRVLACLFTGADINE